MPLPHGFNHLGSVSIDTPALIPYTTGSLSSVAWNPHPSPCTLALIVVESTDTHINYLQVYDGQNLVAAYPIPPKGIVYERIDVKIQTFLGLILSTSATSVVAPSSPGVVSIGVQAWASGPLP
jgi:hypothetical protein